MSPYLLPEGNVQIAFSGGRTSGFMLHHIAEANGGLPDRVKVVFTNTGREMPETLDFVAECERRWQIEVTRVERRIGTDAGFEVVGHQGLSTDGRPLREIIVSRGFLPNALTRFCSAEAKIIAADIYLRSLGWTDYTKALGFRFDERQRADKKGGDRAGVTRWFPMIEAKVSRRDVVAWWGRQAFDLRLPVARGKTVFGNCDGCFLKSERFLAGLARDFPERHKWWEDMEAEVSRLASTQNATFSSRYSRASLRRFVEAQGDWLLSDEAGLCQRDEGECMA